MPCHRTVLLLPPLLVFGCAANPDRHTLAELRRVEPDLAELRVENSLDQAMLGYRKFLEQAPKSTLTPEAMRRLADLELEKEFGVLGGGGIRELPAPERAQAPPARERAATRTAAAPHPPANADPEAPADSGLAWTGPRDAIQLYDEILASYPTYEHNDQVLYQKARAYDELGRTEEAIAVMERLIAQYPDSRHLDEVQFRRGEHFFVRRKYFDAEHAYRAVTEMGPRSDYYELALYKLGWTYYKQELHEEALHSYVALLDHKVSGGYDFDQSSDEDTERRIADTFRVISLSFSNLGGSEVVQQYFADHGKRSYEDRIYSHLGEFYFGKLRYHDAATAYRTFVELAPLHRSSPHFGMRVVEIYEAGGFPMLVVEAKKEFAASYGLDSGYWGHFDVGDAPEVVAYLKANLEDLANHYHALYQEEALESEQPENFREALRWYRGYLTSFPETAEAPALHYRLADLLLEHGAFARAASEYEHTAYGYPEHERSAAAGYAAIYAHREHQQAADADVAAAQRAAVASTLRFVEAFPRHEHAASVLGAAVDDLYEMGELERSVATAQRLIADYPDADVAVRRSAWTVVAHGSFDLAAYDAAEAAYGRVLQLTPADDAGRQDVIDNLAASIYQQGELASRGGDDRSASAHYLRVAEAAPESEIRPLAEYDAGAALMRLEDWEAASGVLESLRSSHPDHELHGEATKQLAFVYRSEGDLSRAAAEYERVAEEAEEAEQRGEALLLAGELYADAGDSQSAVAVYLRYVDAFPEPIELAIETRFTIAEIHAAAGDEAARREQLQRIVAIDAAAGAERTERVRYLAARSALVLTEGLYRAFDSVALVQPFEANLQEKQRRMDAALAGFGNLVAYEVAEVTAAATFYMAEIYRSFSAALLSSERPTDLGADDRLAYEAVLEEEAFPFEEKAIAVHEKNLELMAAGIYNRWIERSFGRLAELVPGRYAKFETSAGLIGSIDRYAYRAPGARDEVVQ